MQPLDALTLRALARDLQQTLGSGRIHKVQQPTRTEWVFSTFGPGGRGKLYVSLMPDAPCTFWAVQSGAVAAGMTDWLQAELVRPSGFCMLLRKYLVGAQITAVDTLPGERVLNLHLVHDSELGRRMELVLSLELMGRTSNMILVDAQTGHILGAAHTVTESMSRYREVATGLPYIPPPFPEGKRLVSEITPEGLGQLLADVPPEKTAEAIGQHLAGWGRQMTQRLLAARQAEPTPPPLYDWLVGLEAGTIALTPAVSGQGFSLLAPPEGSWAPQPSVSTMLATYFSGQMAQRRFARWQHALRQVIQAQQKKLAAREAGLTQGAEDEVQRLQHAGELILAAHGSGQLPPTPMALATPERVTVDDYLTGEAVQLKVDPLLSWVENAQRYYQKAKKAKARAVAYQEQVAMLSEQRAYLEELMLWLEQAETLAELLSLRDTLVQAGWMKADATASGKGAKKKPAEAVPSGVRRFTSSDGLTIWVGKTSPANGYLLGRVAKPHDAWLHVHQMPGSHVIVRLEKGATVPNPTLLEAANLAVYYSTGRHGSQVPVDVTEVRYVRKIPGSYPGHVTYQKEETYIIQPEEAMLSGLLAQEPGSVADLESVDD
jgi:predicted ribosome quality control (RQC) complex YloA/Tae2 family protein